MNAGLIRNEPAGRQRTLTLRRDEIDRRFPGLLDAVLSWVRLRARHPRGIAREVLGREPTGPDLTVYLRRRSVITETQEVMMRNWFRRTKKTPPTPKPLDPARLKRLPPHVNLRDTTRSQPASPARDPYGGRDTERDFVIRYGDPFDD